MENQRARQAGEQDRQRAVSEHFSRMQRAVLVGVVASLLLMGPAIYLLMKIESPAANIVVGVMLVTLPLAVGYVAARRGDRGDRGDREDRGRSA